MRKKKEGKMSHVLKHSAVTLFSFLPGAPSASRFVIHFAGC